MIVKKLIIRKTNKSDETTMRWLKQSWVCKIINIMNDNGTYSNLHIFLKNKSNMITIYTCMALGENNSEGW